MPDSVTIPQAQTGSLNNRGPDGASRQIALELLHSVKELTERHFPEGPVEVEVDFDPEVPSDQFFVLSVTASGSPKQIAERQRALRREIDELAAHHFDAFRISVGKIV